MRPPMVCDREAMYETIEALCADSMAGRRAASGGDLRAARMLAGMMEKAGCEPLWEEAVVPFHLENTMKALHTENLDFAKRFFAGPWRDSIQCGDGHPQRISRRTESRVGGAL